jgi:hypothetical protein
MPHLRFEPGVRNASCPSLGLTPWSIPLGDEAAKEGPMASYAPG